MAKTTQMHLIEARKRHQWSQKELADRLGTTRNNVSRWERGETIPGPYFRAKLSSLFGKSFQELGFHVEHLEESQPTPISPSFPAPDQNLLCWHVPYPRNTFFTGRDELLHEVHTRLSQDHTMALTQSWAISGLGGIGKTQIALEYAYRYRNEYRFVFWMSAATQETLLTSLVRIAELVHLPGEDTHDHTRLIRAVKEWFASQQQWLVILDNVEDIAVLQSILPTEHAGHVLLTTRAQALGALAQRIEVETMGVAEASLFLLRRARLLAPLALLDQAMHAHLDAAETIAIEMDFLPLALDQAGAYIEEVGCSLSTYLERYRTHRKELLQRRGHVPDDHPESVVTTWSLSFQKIEQANPVAAELLRFCAFLEPDAIPEELINEGSAHLGPILGPVATDALKVDEAIQELRAFSLIQRDPEARLLRVHRLVQAVLKDTMHSEEQSQWAERAVQATNALFPDTVEFATWPRGRRALPQAQACSVLIQTHALAFPEAASLLYRTACYVDDFGLAEQAEPLLQHAVRIWEHVLGPEHPTMAHALTRLAHLYREQGKYKQAEPLHQQAVRIQEHALGPEHADVATALNGLAVLYQVQAKYEQAEPLLQRSVRIQEHALGSEHPDVALSLNHLATLFALQGKYEQAEPLYQRALSIWEQALGPEHPHVANSLHGLATLYHKQGKYEYAEPLYQRALSISEQALGPEHPDVAASLHGLATLYRDQHNYERAEPLYQRALHIREHSQPHHPDLATLFFDIAVFEHARGNDQAAVDLYQRALAIQKQALPAQHPAIVATEKAYAEVLQAIAFP